jgi:hypothetical protein
VQLIDRLVFGSLVAGRGQARKDVYLLNIYFLYFKLLVVLIFVRAYLCIYIEKLK